MLKRMTKGDKIFIILNYTVLFILLSARRKSHAAGHLS